jgi:structure-specific recognition protein 1
MDFSKAPGRCRFADSGLGWKPAGGGDTFTLTREQMLHSYWNRAARGYEVKIYRKDAPVVQFDGFLEEDYDRIQKIFKSWYAIPFDRQEHSLRGWNWGKAEFGKAELSFNVQSRSAFDIPFTEVSNTNLAGKGEVAIEFSLPGDGEETGTNGHLGGARGGGKKAGAPRDQLVEMRFYIPGMTAAKTKSEDGEDGEVDEDAEEQQAADVFYQTLSEKAEIGEVAGDTIATFQDVLHLTPRYVFYTSIDSITLMYAQRPFRRGHVPHKFPSPRQNLRLQDPIRLCQEIHDPAQARRNARPPYSWPRSTFAPRSNPVSLRRYADAEGRRSRARAQHEGRRL